jgi:hypothetical protein
MYAPRGMPKWATPRDSGPWDGETEPLLDAARTAANLLAEVGFPVETRSSITWEGGQAHEDSVEATRDALRFSEPPTELLILIDTEASTDNGVQVSVWASQSPPSALKIVEARGRDFDLTGRVFDSTRRVAFGEPTEPLGEPPTEPSRKEIADKTETATPTETKSVGDNKGHSGPINWIEQHPVLVGGIGMGTLGIVALIVIAIATH